MFKCFGFLCSCFLVNAVLFGSSCDLLSGQDETKTGPQITKDTKQQQGDSQKETGTTEDWKALFDGKSLDGWKKTSYGGEGAIIVEEGVIKMNAGVTLTGLTSTREDLPKIDYEIEWEARRTGGLDFFAAVTFPFKESHCTFVPGGWSGGVTGLSNIDDMDASENDTTSFVDFDDEKWYKMRVQVRAESIRCWVNEKKVVDQKIGDEKVGIRPEVVPTTPLGISAWQSDAEIKSFRVRPLKKRSEEDEKSDGGKNSESKGESKGDQLKK